MRYFWFLHGTEYTDLVGSTFHKLLTMTGFPPPPYVKSSAPFFLQSSHFTNHPPQKKSKLKSWIPSSLHSLQYNQLIFFSREII